MRFGMLGADSLRTAMMMGIGHGTVFLYCRRVTRALRELGESQGLVQWGNRRVTEAWVRERTGLKGCIGMLDGTLIQLTTAPQGSFSIFFCRKKFFAVRIIYRV